MCEVCEHIAVYVNNSYDPTRTTTLRNLAVRESNRRFDSVIKAILEVVTEENFNKPEVLQSLPPDFKYLSNEKKIKEFLNWLETYVDSKILEIYGIPQGVDYKNWLNKYLHTAYQRGVARAREELRKAGYTVPTIVASGGLKTVMQAPIHVDSVALLYTRAFNDLKGITDAMRTQIGRLLAEGLARGTNPRVLARRMVAAINGKGMGDLGLVDSLGRFIPARRRAEILARTEIIRAHHYANVNEYKTWGAFGVSVVAEFRTAGDDRVCEECAALEGKIFTLDEILPMIPVHPQCRCVALPIVNPKNKK